jgi:hypothetical protein
MSLQDDISRSLNKSEQLSKLQNIIWGDLRAGETGYDLANQQQAKNEALEEYWNLCESDKDIARLMQEYHLSRKDLNDLYMKLIHLGLGQWTNEHFVALSAIAYGEPLYYLVESQQGYRDKEDIKEVAYNILLYFREEIPTGGLCKRLESSDSQPSEQENSHHFCGYCGVKNIAEYSYCTDCGKPLKESLQKEDSNNIQTKAAPEKKSRPRAEPQKKNKVNLVPWESLRAVLLFITSVIFIYSVIYWREFLDSDTTSSETLSSFLASTLFTTAIIWAVVLRLTKYFRRVIDGGNLFLSGFLGMISFWGGTWSAHLVGTQLSNGEPDQVIYGAILLSPVWFALGLLGNVLPEASKSVGRKPKKTYTLTELFLILALIWLMLWVWGEIEPHM